MMARLLAKSPLGGRHVFLSDHARTVLETATLLFGTADRPARLGREWFRFFRLSDDWFPAFVVNLGLAALFHDLGKANDGFQAEVQGKPGSQAIRHEHLSALLIAMPEIQAWLRRHPLIDFEIVASAVVAHHLKVKDGWADRPGHEFAGRMQDVPGFRVFVETDDFREILQAAGRVLGSQPPVVTDDDAWWGFDEGPRTVRQEAERFRREFGQFAKVLRRDERRRRRLLAVRAGLIAADAAGSALVRTGAVLETWLSQAFAEPLTAEDIQQKVLAPRIEELRRSSGAFEWHEFQVAAANLGPRAVLLAGCGTGKTLAAWRWIGSQLARRPAARAIFLYPTRGTTTEGFRDYVSWAGPEDAALIHGTSAYTLEGLFSNPDDAHGRRRGQDYGVDPRLFALGYWPRRVISATVDSFLAFMSHAYMPICLLPLLADSVVVVDEVHSFDGAMFKALVRFLDFFDLPVLCMTASLTADRLAHLERVGLQRFPADRAAFDDLTRQMEYPRYRIQPSRAEEAEQAVLRALGEGAKRVLWVFNTVARCQDAATRLRAKVPPGTVVLCYHSRYRLMDRNRRHEEVIAQFRTVRTRPVLVLCTQVCEMSLDLDADMLVSEVAPVPSLIQRMGRCCREAMPRSGRTGDVLVYPAENARPYETVEVKQGEQLIQWSAGRVVSQARLGAYLDELPVDPVVVDGYVSFLGSGWWAWNREDDFREGDDYALDAVLDADIPAVLAARADGRPVDGWVVPVPRRLTTPDERLGFLRRAPASHYDPDLGFLDAEVLGGG
jgi:CRISPR-associated endonuclease/helicase Cas3